VIFEGTVYDIDEYKGNHPGGAGPIKEFYGKNIDQAFSE
jgi:cytochrome b involved in lipid metabolism